MLKILFSISFVLIFFSDEPLNTIASFLDPNQIVFVGGLAIYSPFYQPFFTTTIKYGCTGCFWYLNKGEILIND